MEESPARAGPWRPARRLGAITFYPSKEFVGAQCDKLPASRTEEIAPRVPQAGGDRRPGAFGIALLEGAHDFAVLSSVDNGPTPA